MATQKNDIEQTFRELMHECRRQRKLKTSITVRALAKTLQKTENYVSAFENGRVFPSIKTFLEYLTALNFDLAPLLHLSIRDGTSTAPDVRQKSSLITKIYDLNESQVKYLSQQISVAESFQLRPLTKRKRTKKSN